MGLEIYKHKKVEVFLLKTNFRWTGKCLDIADGFMTIENDRDGRILSIQLTEIETIREVRA